MNRKTLIIAAALAAAAVGLFAWRRYRAQLASRARSTRTATTGASYDGSGYTGGLSIDVDAGEPVLKPE